MSTFTKPSTRAPSLPRPRHAPDTAPQPEQAPPGERSVRAVLLAALSNQQVVLLLTWLGMVVFFASQSDVFLSTEVFGNILLDWGPVVLIAVGQTFVIVSGGIDLSVGASVGLSGVVAAYAMRGLTGNGVGQSVTLLLGLLVAVGTGTAVGLVNGLLINHARIVPFIATLATLGAAGGLSIVLTDGGPVSGGPADAVTLSVPTVGPFSWPGLAVVAVVVTAGLFLHCARFGRCTFAIGSNAFAARAAGIDVKRHVLKVYALSGLLAGLAGMYFYLRLGSGAPSSGKGAELDAIAAVVIGGASLAGGVGRMTGTVLGALILTTVTSGLILIGVAPNWKQVVVAVLIAGAVSLQGLRPSVRGAA